MEKNLSYNQSNVVLTFCPLFFFRGTWVTNFKVDTSLEGGALTERTEGYVSTTSCRTQHEPDQYGTVWITAEIDKVL